MPRVPCSHGAFQEISTGASGFSVSKSVRSVISNVTGDRTGLVSESADRVISGALLIIIMSLLTEWKSLSSSVITKFTVKTPSSFHVYSNIQSSS